ncbi:MAG: FKBP-type peptidyl-prolyl cis-trans isomerase [Rhizomicrobium sp.]
MTRTAFQPFLLLACLALAGCACGDAFMPVAGETPHAMQLRYLDWSAHRPGWSHSASGLLYRRIGDAHPSGAVPKPDSIVTVACDGHFVDGKPFFATEPDKPLVAPVTKFIKGWQEGLLLMHAGESFEFVLPPDLAYGEKGRPPQIPPDAALLFKIELLAVVQPSERTAP